MDGFAYPNEAQIGWSLIVVLYPFTTGLIAGVFIVSALYYVFNVQSLKPLARFSLVTALAFVILAPLPLAIHLGRPDRALEIFLTPHFTSAMAMFGYIWIFYMGNLMIQTWLVFRKDIVAYALTGTGLRRRIYSVMALGVYDLSAKSLAIDRRLVKLSGAIGIPTAWILFHGYSGFIFGSVKANPWWSTPLMPIIFLFSAVVSGMALLIVLYVAAMGVQRKPINHDALRSLAGWLTGFLAVNVTIEVLEVVTMMYMREESWETVRELITQRLAVSYLGIQLLLGSAVPLVVLGVITIFQFRQKLSTLLASAAAVLTLVGVFAMRWNVVIGGQILSKSLRGFLSYTPEITGRDGILVALFIMALPFELFALITYFIPPWREAPVESSGVQLELNMVKPDFPRPS
jgi:Ni/Fe-hydrogenase subunit HybB-like protein